MPRYNVKIEDKYACFSSIVDAFLTPFMSEDEYENWRTEEYGRTKLPLDRANKMTLADALYSLSLNKSDEDICNNLRFANLIYRGEE